MRRLLLLLSALCLVLATAGCGGDDDQDQGEDGTDKPTEGLSKPDPEDQLKERFKTAKCDAEASMTGAYEAHWSGPAEVRTGGRSVEDSGPAAVYTLNHKNNRVALYSPGLEFKGSISLIADGKSYSSDPDDAESFAIDEEGKHAKVDTALISISGDEVRLVAEFTCGEPKQ